MPMRRGVPVRIDDVHAGDLRLLAAILGVRRHVERLVVRAQDACPCPCRTTPARRRDRRARAVPPSTPHWYMRMLSVSCSPAACMAWRLAALRMWLRPVPLTRQRAGSLGMIDGGQNAPRRRRRG